MTAAYNGLFSLSANQISIQLAVFAMHRNIPSGFWFHKSTEQNLDQDQQAQLNVEDYDIYINPQLKAETRQQEYCWEYCPSFIGLRCMVKRPLGIFVSYMNEEGDEIEKEIFDFQARVFLHELDHIDGRTMTHWRLSEGNIDIIDSEKDNHKNLASTIDFYKHKVQDMKRDFPHMFDETRKHEKIIKDGKEWNNFHKEGRESSFKIEDQGHKPSFEDAMLLDMVRASRKDTLARDKKQGKQSQNQ
ncbi:peptide deformylase [Stylonychia lemnae]|uniref:Peptide deformylase n=1 Tax=Stylonychia lemnae TaxID=5949 RepID=A0A078BA20_STYLE|nr:peptide deformylase [Stylonychia lemnae]|eukprot:CDW90117.1 peptide deformylase [Stylonychia lemnae]